MRDAAGLRLLVLRVLVLSLLLTLGARLYYLQVLDKNKLTQTANAQHTRQIVVPAPRGSVVDDVGRPLIDNRTALVIAVDRSALDRQADRGKAVLARLAALIHVPAQHLSRQVTPCAPHVPKPCWTGSPYQPVPVLNNASPAAVLHISEHREDFPGVVADAQEVRQYPAHTVAAHELGYVGPVTQEELDTNAADGRSTLNSSDLVGRSGLEESYDSTLRGVDGIKTVTVNNSGQVTGTASATSPRPGDTLVTSIDAKVQALADQSLAAQIKKSRATFDYKSGKKFAAPSGAAVVMDPRTGRVLALASYPTFDPNVFVGGISQKEFQQLSGPDSGDPMVSRATQGQFAPGSTFKLSTSSAIVMDGQTTLNQTGNCPPKLQVGNQTKTNYDSESISGPITLGRALAFSCDTFFYRYAIQAWYADQNQALAGKKPAENLQNMARDYGFGSKPGIDLPAGQQSAGQIVGRAFLKQRWEANKAQYCGNAKKGYPQVSDPTRRAFLTLLAKENCSDGWRYNIGEAADLAIGQGETTVSPLQLATAYSAMANGGTLFEPTIGKAIVNSHGKVVKRITPTVRRKVPVRQDVLNYIKNALTFGKGGVSGETAFVGFPFTKDSIGGKTGTAEVFGKQDTSWFASWGPVKNPQFVVVGMIEQAGLGSGAAAPMVRKIDDGIYGLTGRKHTPVIAGSKPPSTLPKIAPYAQSVPPGDIVGSGDAATPTPSATPAADRQVRPMPLSPDAILALPPMRSTLRRSSGRARRRGPPRRGRGAPPWSS
jgi:penicillin-binding protein 2